MVKHLKLAKELALPPDVVTQKINVLGQSGGGKTYLAMKLAEPTGGSVGDYISALVSSGCADAKSRRGPYEIGHALFLGVR